jgi:hypothetical protein
MSIATVQFTATRYANTTASVPEPQSVGHLNLDEGFVPGSSPPVPNSPGVTDYIYQAAINKSFQPWKFAPVPDDVDVVNKICIQFYHSGAGYPVADFQLYKIGVPSVLLQEIRVNLETSGYEAAQIIFDNFGTLTKAEYENDTALHMKMLAASTGGGQDPTEYDPGWTGD